MKTMDVHHCGPPNGNDVPCRGMATYMLDLAKRLLTEKCEQHDGYLTAAEIEDVFNKLRDAPGDLPKIYASKFSTCSAEIIKSAKDQDNPTASFQNELSNIVGNSAKTIAVGHLQTVGLNNIRSSLGDRWKSLADRVIEIAEHCITKRLTSHDTFARTPDNNFIICFAELSGEEAMFKAKTIEADITQTLLGKNEQNDLAQFDLSAEQRDELANLRVEAHEIEVAPTDPTSDEFLEILLGKLDRAAKDLHEDTARILDSLARSCEVRPRTVLRVQGKPTNTTMLGWDADAHAKSKQLKFLCNSDIRILAELDRISLLSAATYLCQQRYTSLPILSIGVNFETLNTKQFRSDYLDACYKLSNEIRGKITFNIRIPRPHLQHFGALDRISVLRPFSVALSIQIEEPDLEGLDWKSAGLTMVVMDHNDFLAHINRRPTSIKLFSDKLHTQGVKLLVDQVPQSTKTGLLRDHGVEFYVQEIIY